MKHLYTLLFCVLSFSFSFSQSTLSTALADNGSGGVFLTLTTNTTAVNIISFNTYFASASGSSSVVIYTRSGSYAGFTASNAGWTLLDTVNAISAGTTTLASINVDSLGIWIPKATTQSFYLHSITSANGLRYTGTAGLPPVTTFSDGNIQLFSDVSRTGNVAFAGNSNTPRAFAGNIEYHTTLPTVPSDNGSGGVFTTLTTNTKSLKIERFNTYFTQPTGGTVAVEVYERNGSYFGFTNSNVGWTLLGTVNTVTTNSSTLASIDVSSLNIVLPASSTRSFYLHSTTSSGGIRYTGTTGTPPVTTYSDGNMQLFSDVSRTGNVAFAGAANTPRTYAGNIDYTVLNCTTPVSGTQSASICAGESYLFNGVQYTTNNTTAKDTLPAANGCDSIITLALVVNSLPQPTITQSGNTLTSSAFPYYQWLRNGSPTGDSLQSFTATLDGDYSVIATDANGCSDTSASVNITVLGISNFLSNVFSIYPNPSSGRFVLSSDVLEEGTIAVYNLSGAKVFEATPAALSFVNVDVSQQPKGIYLVKVSTARNVWTERIVITE